MREAKEEEEEREDALQAKRDVTNTHTSVNSSECYAVSLNKVIIVWCILVCNLVFFS